jgi:hypothetical protein
MSPFLFPQRVAIVGSREFLDLQLVRDYVARLHAGCTVVSGGARGVDRAAERSARARGLAVVVFPADWVRLGRRAGVVRNREIVDACDFLVAFWDGASPGTRHSLDYAAEVGRPHEIVSAMSAPGQGQERAR